MAKYRAVIAAARLADRQLSVQKVVALRKLSRALALVQTPRHQSQGSNQTAPKQIRSR